MEDLKNSPTKTPTINLPLVNYKVKDKLAYKGLIVYVSDIIFSLMDFNWYAVLFEIDENEIIQKNMVVPALDLNSGKPIA